MKGLLSLGMTLAFALVFNALASEAVLASEGNVRMYTINKKQQQTRIRLGNSASEAGCHDLRFKKQVHRFAQAGFAWCQLFSESECIAETIIPALWKGRTYRRVEFDHNALQPKLYPGSDWVLAEDAPKIKAWFCEAK
ncbi:MAG: hypothetical protein V3V09_05810 [Arenicellales bacterium]